MGNRWGGTKLDMRQDLKTLMLMQYTFWRDWKDHEEMHRQNWANLFRLCLQQKALPLRARMKKVYNPFSGLLFGSNRGEPPSSECS